MKILQCSSCVSLFLMPLAIWAADAAAPGVPNFHQVNDHIYRGGQPSDEAWSSLARLGVKTVIDLRLEDEHPTKLEARAVEGNGMRYFNVPMHGVVAPSDAQVARVLALLDSNDGSVFVHCRRGADRTGTVIACYRMTHDGWDNQRAFQEAKSYGMSWTQLGMKHYLMSFRAPTVRAASAPELAAAPVAAGQP
jgi:tyrosine-protein phosphatase SIW14